MARSARRPKRLSIRRSKTVRGDWVYNSATYTPLLATVDNASIAMSLYDSQDSERVLKFGTTVATMSFRSGTETPRGSRDTILAVEGHINVTPAEWDPGGVVALGWRIVAFDQESNDGFFLPAINYTMWDNLVAAAHDPALFANQPWLAEGREYRAHSADQPLPIWKMNMRWTGRWRMQPQQGLALYLETANTSADVRIQPWLRVNVARGM